MERLLVPVIGQSVMNNRVVTKNLQLLENERTWRKLSAVSEKALDSLKQELDAGVIQVEDVTHCVCCGGESFIQVSSIDRYGLPFGNLLCDKCGLLSCSPRIKEASLPYYYGTYYHALNYGVEDISSKGQLFAFGQGRKVYNSLSPNLEEKSYSVLEVGSGLGDVLLGFVKEAKNNGYSIQNVTGLDYSASCNKEAARRAGVEGIEAEFAQGGFESLKEMGQQYDIVILSHVLEHCVDLRKTITLVLESLKLGGLLYIEVPGLYQTHLIKYYYHSFVDYTVHAHMYNFSADSLRNALQGFPIESLSINERVESVFIKNDVISNQNIKDISSSVLAYLTLISTNEHFNYFEAERARSRELDDLQVTESNLRNQCIGLEDEVNSLLEQLKIEKKSFGEERDALQDMIIKLRGELDNLQGTETSLRNQCIGFEDEIHSLREDVTGLESSREVLQREFRHLNIVLQDYKSSVLPGVIRSKLTRRS
jgi:ubiquinone/menaquinone biosynthesis C-methylase UbiE